MIRNAPGISPRAVVCIACALAGWLAPAQAVIVKSGNSNTDSASLIADGGPGGPNQPGFDNVGRRGSNGPSVTYLGNGWALAAGHASITSAAPIVLGGNSYTVDDSSTTFLHNPDNSLADLKLVRFTTEPNLPAITPDLISSTTPTGRQIMIGNGFQRGDATYWQVDDSQSPWVWTEQAAPAVPGADDYAGFKIVADHSMIWGENEVLQTGLFALTYFDNNNDPHFVHGYSTQFDDAMYTGQAGLTHEAQLSLNDSGGAVFTLVNGQWQLGGIMVAIWDQYSGQPQLTAVYGNQSLIIDLSVYRDEILGIVVPEPSGFVLAAAAGGLALLALFRRRRG
ncbi:MAG: hypothetical protein WD845_10465 [Pirellulales bacterium]